MSSKRIPSAAPAASSVVYEKQLNTTKTLNRASKQLSDILTKPTKTPKQIVIGVIDTQVPPKALPNTLNKITIGVQEKNIPIVENTAECLNKPTNKIIVKPKKKIDPNTDVIKGIIKPKKKITSLTKHIETIQQKANNIDNVVVVVDKATDIVVVDKVDNSVDNKAVDKPLDKPLTSYDPLKDITFGVMEIHDNTATASSDDSWDNLFKAMNSTDVLLDIPEDTTEAIQDEPQELTKNKLEISLDTEQKFRVDVRNTVCSCGHPLYINGNKLICKECGVESLETSNFTEEEYSTSAITDCNVNSNGFIAMKMIGKGSYGYQRSLLKTCANYSKYRKINTLKDMNNWNNNNAKKQHIPKNVIQEANDMFAKIKEHGYVFRKDGKKGVLSACLYYACYNNNISKTPSEIAQFSGIDERFHSLGDRILHDLNEKGVIEIPIKINPIADYVDRYIELLDIPKKYRAFVLDLITRAEKKRIHILHDSKGNTKASGAIYMLVCRVPELSKKITKEMIETQCGISKTTFVRYYTTLCTYHKKIKKIFKRHGISMPIEWKDT
jgi:transcription initiation factor TFIIIB Brf1 subunit/transcription initiation factor TFIIB